MRYLTAEDHSADLALAGMDGRLNDDGNGHDSETAAAEVDMDSVRDSSNQKEVNDRMRKNNSVVCWDYDQTMDYRHGAFCGCRCSALFVS